MNEDMYAIIQDCGGFESRHETKKWVFSRLFSDTVCDQIIRRLLYKVMNISTGFYLLQSENQRLKAENQYLHEHIEQMKSSVCYIKTQ